MIWIDNVSQLSYLTTPSWADCYCELITEPNDVLLQAQIDHALVTYPNGEVYDVKVHVYSADGQTFLENASEYFEWFVYLGNQAYFCNLRMLRVTDIMCSAKCFILHVIIERVESGGMFPANYTVFDKYTERYCVDNCCLLPSNIEITQNYAGS